MLFAEHLRALTRAEQDAKTRDQGEVPVQVSEEEAAAGLLGREWPAPEVLLSLQRQCVDISHAAKAREEFPGAKRLIISLSAALHGTSCLLDRMHYFPSRHQAGDRQAAVQAIERLELAARPKSRRVDNSND